MFKSTQIEKTKSYLEKKETDAECLKEDKKNSQKIG